MPSEHHLLKIGINKARGSGKKEEVAALLCTHILSSFPCFRGLHVLYL